MTRTTVVSFFAGAATAVVVGAAVLPLLIAPPAAAGAAAPVPLSRVTLCTELSGQISRSSGDGSEYLIRQARELDCTAVLKGASR